MFTLKNFDDVNKALNDLNDQVIKLKQNVGNALSSSKNIIKGWFGLGNTPVCKLYLEGDAQNWANLVQTMIAIKDTDAANNNAIGGRLARFFNRRNTCYVSQNMLTTDGINWILDQVANGGILVAMSNASFTIQFATAGANPRTVSSMLSISPTTIGFWGSAAVIKQILNGYVSNSQNIAYNGIGASVAGTPYAQVADLNSLRIAYENLRQGMEDLRTKMQTSTFVG